MIPKKEMIGGQTYKGFCRNNFIATWNDKKQMFYYMRWKFGPMADWLHHFEDVQGDILADGFVPLEPLERFPDQLVNQIKKDIGY